MRYLIVSGEGKSIGLARRLESEGHAVQVYIVSLGAQKKGAGIVSIIRTPRPILDSSGSYNLSAIEWLMSTARPDITIFDSPTTHTMATKMQSAGHRVIGPTSDIVERARGALNAGRLSIFAYFNGGKFLEPLLFITTYPQLFNDNIGPDALMGNVARFVDSRHPLAQDFLYTVANELKVTSYRGPVTAGIDHAGVVHSWTPGTPDNAVLLYENIQGNLSQLFIDCVNGAAQDHSVIDEYVIAVRVSLPPFPYNLNGHTQSYEITGLNELNMKHFWPNDLANTLGVFATTACDNDLGYFTARAGTIREAQRRVYRTLRNIKAPQMQYRTDIGLLRAVQGSPAQQFIA